METLKPISAMVLIIIIHLVLDTIYFYLSGNFVVMTHAAIVAFSSDTSAILLMIGSIGSIGLLTAFLLANNE